MRLFFTIVFSISFLSCNTQKVTFNSDEPVKAILQPLGNFGATPDIIPTLPATFPLEDLEGKMVRVEGPDGRIQYWMFPTKTGAKIEINFKGSKIDSARSTNNSSLTLTNKVLRMTLEAYDSLAQGEPQIALKLSEEIALQQPSLAVSRIIEALAKVQLGDVDGAKAALVAAQSLDPEDKKIAKMLGEM